MKHIFALTNHKGGVGKSTSATNIALGIVGILHNAGAANPRVLLIDTDSQAHATLVATGRNDYGTDNKPLHGVDGGASVGFTGSGKLHHVIQMG